MAHSLKDMFQAFSDMTSTDQTKLIEDIRYNRTIERPAVAVRKKKAEVKKTEQTKSKINKLVDSLSPEQKAAIKQALLKGKE